MRRLAGATAARGGEAPSDEQIAVLAVSLCDPNQDEVVEQLCALGRSDQPFAPIVRDYLAPLARRLGEGWEEDEFSFVEVGIAMSRLHLVLRRLERHRTPQRIRHDQTLFFATVPGETHMLGSEMAAGLFREAGWDVELHLGLEQAALDEALIATPAMVVGLSASGLHSIEALRHSVATVRLVRPDMVVVVGGAIVDAAPEAVEDMAPDATFADAMDALTDIRRLTMVV